MSSKGIGTTEGDVYSGFGEYLFSTFCCY